MTTAHTHTRRHATIPSEGITARVTHPVPAVVGGVVAIVVVAVYGFSLKHLTALQQLDQAIVRSLSRDHITALVTITRGVYTVFSPVEAIILTLILSAIIWLVSRRFRAGLTFAVIVAVTWIPSDVLKILVHRPRPDPALLAHPFLPEPTDPSYPSGHAVFIVTLAMAFIFLARGSAAQPLVIVVAAIVALLLVSALPYLGVHYPSDVIASIVWSVGVSSLVLVLWNRFVVPKLFLD